jgi:hypothetical protein
MICDLPVRPRMKNEHLGSFGCLFALISFCQIRSSTISPVRPVSFLVSARPHNAKSVCAAATNTDVCFSIYQQCILSETEEEIPHGVGEFVALQPSIFSRDFANESHFRKALFEEVINPLLGTSEVCAVDFVQ